MKTKRPYANKKHDMRVDTQNYWFLDLCAQDDLNSLFARSGISVPPALERRQFATSFSWAIPSKDALTAIVNNVPTKKVVEIGGGTGLWARLLQDMGMTVRCFDTAPPFTSLQNSYGHDALYTEVKVGGPKRAADYPDHALLLCWPPYKDNMALHALRAYTGDTLIYIGEDRWGRCADTDFFNLMCELFDTDNQVVVPIPTWSGIHDNVHILKRQSSGSV